MYVVGVYDLSIGHYINCTVYLSAPSAFGMQAAVENFIQQGTGRGNRSLGKHRQRRDNNIKMNFMEMGGHDVELD